jgi:hypothetical protein
MIVDATLPADLGISSVEDVTQQRNNKHHNKIKAHENPLLKTLMATRRNIPEDDILHSHRPWYPSNFTY